VQKAEGATGGDLDYPKVNVDINGLSKAEGATGEDCYFELLLLK
jgi:hypothetical protein